MVCALVYALLDASVAGSAEVASWIPLAFMGLCLAVVCFYYWPLYATYYTLSHDGIHVRYGPWSRKYAWSEFACATWQRGMFAMRIGWPSVTPCVRLTDAVLLRRNRRGFGLFLTPNDSRAFLRRVSKLAPDLTWESIF
ncbi:MAG TPA: hypothetical protein VFV24_00445 [Candidatus Eisenbacteria bacterium]|nr:hypothetical protein [Candidatus Eisenbacteria bacterium]